MGRGYRWVMWGGMYVGRDVGGLCGWAGLCGEGRGLGYVGRAGWIRLRDENKAFYLEGRTILGT